MSDPIKTKSKPKALTASRLSQVQEEVRALRLANEALKAEIAEHRRIEEDLRSSLAEFSQRQQEIAALLGATRAILVHRRFPETARSIFNVCKRLTGATAGYVALLSPDGTQNEVLFLDSGGLPCQVDPSLPMPIRGLREVAYRTGRAVMENDFASSPWQEFMPQGHAALENVLFAPLPLEGRVVGVLGLANKPGGFVSRDLSMATAFGELAALALRESRAAEALETSERKYRELADSLPEAVFETDAQGRFVYLNRIGLEKLGLDQTDLARGVSIWDLLHPQERSRAEANLALRLEGRLEGPSKYLVQRKDGLAIPVQINLAPITKGGQFMGLRGIAEDLTQRKRQEAEKQRLEAQLRQTMKLEAIGALAGGIAHDFNNILAAILGYTELVMADLPEAHPARRNLEQVFRAGQRAKELVQQILSFSRQAQPEKRPLQIGPIVKEALQLLRASLPTTIEIRQNLAAYQGVVLAEADQIHQILMNLCANAAFAMREKGGVLEVRLERIEADEAFLTSCPELKPGGYLCLSVSDTGHGMSQEVIERIFEPFFTTKGPGQGTGMGLAVVHGIVRDHGGAISVYSQPGQGTTFHIYLPLYPGSAEESQPEALLPLPTGQERILFVDDEPDIADVSRQILERLGYSVTIRTSSQEALELFRARPSDFDLVITDQTMPRLTGLQLAAEILKIKPKMPVILCTGYSELVSPEKAKALGIRQFLMKPLVVRQVAEAVRAALDEPA